MKGEITALRAAWDADPNNHELEQAYRAAIAAHTGAVVDTDFSRAVRLAATGLDVAHQADPAIAGEALAAILRDDRPLDAHGMELLAQMVTGRLRKRRQPDGESDLAQAVRSAGAAWRKAREANPAVTGVPLAAILRGDPSRLGAGERALLADLVTRGLRKSGGRPSMGAGHPQRVGMSEAFQAEIESGTKRKDAIDEIINDKKITGKSVKIHPRTLEKNVSKLKRRNDAARDAVNRLKRAASDNESDD